MAPVARKRVELSTSREEISESLSASKRRKKATDNENKEMTPAVRKKPIINSPVKNKTPTPQKENIEGETKRSLNSIKPPKKKADNEETKKKPVKKKPLVVSPTKEKLVTPQKENIQGKAKKKRNSKKLVNTSEEKPMIPIEEMNVEQLLALGENSCTEDFSINENDFEGSSESDSDFEEVKDFRTIESVIPKEGINITLEVPNLYNKRKKGSLDLEGHLRRQINRVRKDLQLLMHKVHLLCWIAHLRFVNIVCNDPAVLEICASFVKSKNLYPSKRCDLAYLEGILKWFHKTIPLKKDFENAECTGGLLNELKYQLEHKEAYSSKAFILMFIILLRVIGLKARIVMSFQVLPVKPSLLELYGDLIKQRSEKLKQAKEAASTSKVEVVKEETTEKNKSNKKSEQKKKKSKDAKAEPDSGDEFESRHFKPSLKTQKKQKSNETSNADKTKKKSKGKSALDESNIMTDSEDDNDFTIVSLKKKDTKKSKKSVKDGEEPQKKKEGIDIWTEVYLEVEEKWISVDVPRQKIHCVGELYSRATHPVVYVIACNANLTLKDVTKRYVPNWHSGTRKKRVDEEWWNDTMKPYRPAKTAQDKEEDDDINQQLLDKPLPSSISEFKDHPLYALKRHLLKFEAIYPPNAPTLGFVRGEPVYARECVVTLHSREMWYKQARVVRLKETPYKIVKARPKYDKMTGEIKKDLPLELFGKWQTEDFIPPIATNGKVPRNEYGNVDLFKPCMLPIGTVHLQVPGLIKIAKKLDIDCAPATVGFDFHSGGSHPVFDGFVVCEEFKEVLLDAWNKEIDESTKKEEEKRDKRVCGNWKRLIRGLMIREKLKIKYAFGEHSDEEPEKSVNSSKTS